MFWGLMKTRLIVRRGCVSCCEQCLHSVKTFPASPATPPASGLGTGKRFGGDRPGAADPGNQRDIPYHTMSCLAMKAGLREEFARAAVAQGLAGVGHWLAGAEQLWGLHHLFYFVSFFTY